MDDRLANLTVDLRAHLLERWTEQEEALFTQRFIEVGKDFPLIADALPRKLRKKAINEENGIRTRRVKSCGSGKGNKPSQRLGNADKVTGVVAKGKLRKTFSCPEANVLQSANEAFINNYKRIANEGADHEKGLRTEISTGINKNSVDTRKRKLNVGVNRIKDFRKLSSTHDQWFNISNCKNSQDTSVKMNKLIGQTRRLVVEITKQQPCSNGKLNKGRYGEGSNDSAKGVRPSKGTNAKLEHLSNMKQMDDSNTGNNQEKNGFSKGQSSRSNCKNKGRYDGKITTKRADKTTDRSYGIMQSETSCSGGKDAIKDHSARGKKRKRSCINEEGAHKEPKCFKKEKTKSFGRRHKEGMTKDRVKERIVLKKNTTTKDPVNSTNKLTTEPSRNDNKIKAPSKGANLRKNPTAANCCDASKRKSIVVEVRDHKHKHSSDRYLEVKLRHSNKNAKELVFN
ncbi:hypothetical protein OS493_001029 [Desmophyllum pertusum]|uniref:Uncharacterized protein n=1 Tax=Desmophyllum pertusum TaxID=174260 RepID=A0A9X0D7F6_9CNID|nr:hypothetical protein OS493_001029 [Desmophyllum pertusum]